MKTSKFIIHKPFLVKQSRNKASKGFGLHVPFFSQLIQLMTEHEPLMSSDQIKTKTLNHISKKEKYDNGN